jgi:hypothetical protein
MRKLLLLAPVVVFLAATATKQDAAPSYYIANLEDLNNSGVSGKATLVMDGDWLQVKINAHDLEPNVQHAQHIHGPDGDGTCPPASADTDGDGLISVGEGAPFYGPVLLPLDAYPYANADGDVKYQNSFAMSQDLMPLTDRVIVLHGMTVDGEYIGSLPVACGEIVEMDMPFGCAFEPRVE